MLKLYEKYMRSLQAIFGAFKKVEKIAVRTRKRLRGQHQNLCRKMSFAIKKHAFSRMQESMLRLAVQNYEFLYNSHKGGQCAICDADLQPFFRRNIGTIRISNSFCASFVENSLSFYIFKDVHFVRIARLYGQFLRSCDAKGKYKPNVFMPRRVTLFNNDKFVEDIERCQEGMKGNDA